MKKIYLLLFLSCLCASVYAQTAASYNFSAFTGTYTSISGTGTAISGGMSTCDDCTTTSIPIGFTFSYCGTNYTQLSACSNGFLSLDNSTGANFDVGTSYMASGGIGLLMPFWCDLYSNPGGYGCTGTAYAYYQTAGTAPNRTFTFEWKNFRAYGGGSACVCCEGNFQVILYESTNVIDFVYGTSTLSGMGYSGLAIGIANSTTDYQTLNNNSTSPTPSSTTFYYSSSPTYSTEPANNQVYRWSNQCMGTPSPGSALATVSGGCATYTSILSLSGGPFGTGMTYQWQSSPDNITWTNIPGATGLTYTATVTGTIYYRCVLTCFYSGLSANSTSVELILSSPPSAISGPTTVCVGSTSTYTDPTPGGHWTSSITSVATIGSSTGILNAVSAGTTVVSYIMPAGCYSTVTVNVVTSPLPIAGSSTICAGTTSGYSDGIGGGTWSSSNIPVATIGSSSGLASGLTPGVVIFTYSLGTCSTTKTVTVNASPAAISGLHSICVGSSTLLTDPTAGGSWSSSSGAIATITSSGVVTGITAGVVTISYTLGDLCYSTYSFTVNALPSGISGLSNICAGTTTLLFDGTPGGTWLSSNPSIATIGATTGFVTGIATGSVTFTYTLATGCFTTFPFTVDPVPSAIYGPLTVCVGSTNVLIDTTAGGIWSATAPYATIDPGTGLDSGVVAGTVIISYTLGSGCAATATVTVNPIPGPITGISPLCIGTDTLYFDPGGGGTGHWQSSATTVATVGSATGMVDGIGAGAATISYVWPTGCAATYIVTIDSLPSAITGPSNVCVGISVTESDAYTGGTWSSSVPTVATISGTGAVLGISPGTTVISYTGGGGCAATRTFTVNSSPGPVSGYNHVCSGSNDTLTDGGGGTWTSNHTGIATIGFSNGIASGVAPGVDTITYSVGAGCITTFILTVNPLPAAISGLNKVCTGQCITLTDLGGGTWSTSGALATVGATTGTVCGVSAGVATITYTLSSLCSATKQITVNPLPSLFTVTGGGSYCTGGTGVHVGLSGSASGVLYQLYVGGVIVGLPVPGTGLPLDFGIQTTGGIYTVIATNASTGCVKLMTGTVTVTISPLPPACNVTGGGTICAGSSGLHVGLTCSSVGVSYQLMLGGAGVGTTISGTGAPLDFGLQTSAGTYTVVGTYAATGCTRIMTGSAVLNVNPLPALIAGPTALCPGTTILLTDATPGGTWTSTNLPIATIGATTGIVTGLTTGTTTILYTLTATGCQTATIVTVSPAPGPIIGPATLCVGIPITLTDIVSGGSWTSSSPSNATIGAFTGVVTPLVPGPTTITYSLGGTSCTVTKSVTVNPGPAAITGPTNVCAGSTIALGDITPGGTWTNSNPSVGTISTTGVVTGIAAGTTTISYAVGAGCPSILPVTVNPLPAAIGGPSLVCAGSEITETDASAGGTWSIAPLATATVVATSGLLTGIISGSATVTYTLPTTCLITRPVTVNPLPAIIGGSAVVCVGLTTTLTDGTPGGTWTHTSPLIGAVSSSGLYTGISNGTDTVTYTISTGCKISVVVTVNSVPTAIVGAGSICVGTTLTLTDPIPGGTWSSAAPSVATVAATSGVVTGVAPGVASIEYASGGCGTSVTVTVIAAPVAMTGLSSVCVGNTITKTDASPGGTWISGAPSLASVSSSGVVTGLSSGTVIISYALSTGCAVIAPVVVNPISGILGTSVVCVGQTTLLTDSTLGGTWTSSASGIASVSAAGIVSGNAAGPATITYMLPTGCFATLAITVNPVPAPVTGPPQVCVGSVITLTDPSSGPGAYWSSSASSIASVDLSGNVTGNTTGSAIISYSYSTGCSATHIVSVNPVPPAPTAIGGGPLVVCISQTLPLTDSITGGSWSSTATDISLSTSGIVTGLSAGTATITYVLPTGCAAATTVTVNAALSSITGTPKVCVYQVTTLTAPMPGGTWSSSAAGIASVDVSGNVSGISAGIATITYSIGSGCYNTMIVTVYPVPAGITGSPMVCQGQSILLADITPGGAWSSSVPATASVIATTGWVHGVAAGSATISYTLAITGCYATYTEVVNPSPSVITGSLQVCVGYTTSLSDATPGGIWSSANTSIATADPTGTVSGISSGITTISYTSSFGCAATAEVTVAIPPVAISGSDNVCQGYATTITDGVTGGTWTSSNPSIASAGFTSGIISGVNPGIATITYSVGAGCSIPKNITVNPTPVPISGPSAVCATQSITLSDGTGGGTWSSVTPAIATIGASTGILTGVSAGVVTISYSIGCAATVTITVNPMPSVITGNLNVCLGGTSALYDSVASGTWTSTNTAVATVGASSGLVSGLTLGTSTIIYALPAGCLQSTLVHVYPLPLIYTVTGGGNYCAGGTGVHVDLSGSNVGINYLLYRGATATGTFAGTGSPLDFGLQTVTGVYTVIATSTATTCSVSMAGSATIDTIPTVTPSLTLLSTPNDTVCNGTTVSLTPLPVNGGPSPFYQWQVNGVNVATTATYSYIPADGDLVEATMTSNAICPLPATANGIVKMTVLPYEHPSVSLSANPGDTTCQGTVVTVTAVPAYGGQSPAYTWMRNGVYSGPGGAYAFVPVNNDQVFCVLFSDYLCKLESADTSAVMVMKIDTPLVPEVTISASPGTMITMGQTLTLTASVVNGGVSPSYQWVKNGLPIPGATNSVYSSDSFSYPMEDSVACQVTSHGLCPATGYKWVYVQVARVGVNTIAGGSDISIIPNPNQGDFTIKGNLGTAIDQEVSLEITDVLGQVVYKGNITARSGKLDNHIQLGNKLANGMYLLTLHSDEASQVFHMIIEQ